jgi:hypothetical protein
MKYEPQSVCLFGLLPDGAALASGWLLIGWRQPNEASIHVISRLAARCMRILTARSCGSVNYQRFVAFQLRWGDTVVWQAQEIDTPNGKEIVESDVIELCQTTTKTLNPIRSEVPLTGLDKTIKTARSPLDSGRPADTPKRQLELPTAPSLPAPSSVCSAAKPSQVGSLLRGPNGRFQRGEKQSNATPVMKD